MPRAGLSPDAVVDHALALIDDEGPDALTLAGVAARAGVATPSLYKHVPGGLGSLRRLIAIRVTEDLADRLDRETAGLGGDEAVTALLRAYHGYATEHPRRYAALPQAPATADDELVRAGSRLVETIIGVLRDYGIEDSEAIHAARTVRALSHGFASLTIAGAFQLREDLAVTQDRLIAVLTSGLRGWPNS
ncbi:AcrR family transcriptional regulator [Kitasatospora sp. MAP12-15]|uniref:TetR/AcrR family transcriptional regulator n=1 Tax=unclassified Kitasatospora TaxID=2633591 RepID=UPI002475E2C0|nr:TetR-like C-terminal domain-containing protein [Kitasatospora sp. MAP12-44]MDH6112171.1 AcrR family transcriptional regulator [Kitasatospora sp. MAP12-44]